MHASRSPDVHGGAALPCSPPCPLASFTHAGASHNQPPVHRPKHTGEVEVEAAGRAHRLIGERPGACARCCPPHQAGQPNWWAAGADRRSTRPAVGDRCAAAHAAAPAQLAMAPELYETDVNDMLKQLLHKVGRGGRAGGCLAHAR